MTYAELDNSIYEPSVVHGEDCHKIGCKCSPIPKEIRSKHAARFKVSIKENGTSTALPERLTNGQKVEETYGLYTEDTK